MFTIVVAFAFSIAAGFLLYLRVQAPQLSVTAIRARSFAEHVVAVFIATLGSMPVAVLLSSPFLIFNRVAHNRTALDIFSQLIDRPYFPLQALAAFLRPTARVISRTADHTLSPSRKQSRPAG